MRTMAEKDVSRSHADESETSRSSKCQECCPEWLRQVICGCNITILICVAITIVLIFTAFENEKGMLSEMFVL